ncbi:MATE family efflux transporter [Butyrivibrio sp. JL13D10]|uniref:MATE family efflux transporter n=1 Tax=Butyrivibrio sp. JL13D10 TaxID=3236815 RepID=UPI0038B42B96
MKTDRNAKRKILRKSYSRLALVSMVVLVATSVCGFVDNVVISNYIGSKALAAVGYFSPVSPITGLVFVLIIGAAILCGNYIGEGEQKKLRALFKSVFLTITAFCILFSILLVALRNSISVILGARGEAGTMLADYIVGFAPSIVFTSLSAFLIALSSFNNEINRSYYSTAIMFFGNIILDLLFAKNLGTFGIGLASTLSSFSSFLILLPAFINKSNTIYFEKGRFDFKELFEAARRGMPSLLFTAGLLVKNSLINYTMISYVGDDGIAVANVLGSMCGIAGTVTGGCTNAESTLLSLSYGEEDRDEFVDVFKIAFQIGITCTFVLVALMMIFSSRLSGIFFTEQTNAYYLGKTMFIWGFWFFPINILINLLMNSYKVQGRMNLVNIMTFVETAGTGIFAFLLVPRFGANAAWMANTWSDLVVAAIIVISVFVWRKKTSLSVSDLLKLPDDFGGKEDEFAEYSIGDMADVTETSEAVMNFCRARNVEGKKALWASLCIEEVTKNILQHGVIRGKQGQISVRIVCKDELTIRVFDDCRKFDPREHINMFDEKTPEKAIGLRMVSKLASCMDYYNNAGINALTLKF